MSWYYSKDTKGFYTGDTPIADLPPNYVEISDELYTQLIDENQQGKEIYPDYDGTPKAGVYNPYRYLDTETMVAKKADDFIDTFGDDNINTEPLTADLNLMSVAQLKKIRKHQITTRFNHAMGWILNSYQEAEINSWSEQKKDADEWITHRTNNPAMTDAEVTTYTGTPMLKELAKGKTNKDDVTLTVQDMDEYKDAIISKSGFFRPYSGGLVGIKKRLLQIIDDQLDDFSGEPDPAAAEQAAKDALKAIDSSEILAAGYAYIVENGA